MRIKVMSQSNEYEKAKNLLSKRINKNIEKDKTQEVIQFIIDNEDELRHAIQDYSIYSSKSAIMKFLTSNFNNYNKRTVSKFLTKKGILSESECTILVIVMSIILFTIPYLAYIYFNYSGITFLLMIILGLIMFFIIACMIEYLILDSRKFFFKNSVKYKNQKPPKKALDE